MMFTLDDLAETIARRAEASSVQSYTRSLLDKGAPYCARKFGEEAIELAIAAVAQDENAVRAEAATCSIICLSCCNRTASRFSPL
jgi:phosphoribosyl-ATP pyrophosphohydrolase